MNATLSRIEVGKSDACFIVPLFMVMNEIKCIQTTNRLYPFIQNLIKSEKLRP